MAIRSFNFPVTVPSGEAGQRITARIVAQLRLVRGVADASFNNARDTLRLTYDSALLSVGQLEYIVRQNGLIQPARIERLTLTLEGLDSPAAAGHLQQQWAAQPGVAQASVNFAASQAHIAFLSGITDAHTLLKQMNAAGVRARPAHSPAPTGFKIFTPAFLMLMLAALLWFAAWAVQHSATPIKIGGFSVARLIYAASILAAGELPLRRGWQKRSLNADVFALLAALGIMALGFWQQAATLMLIFRLGEMTKSLFLHRLRQQARQAVPENAPAGFAPGFQESISSSAPLTNTLRAGTIRLTLLAALTACVVSILSWRLQTTGEAPNLSPTWAYRGLALLLLADMEIFAILGSLAGAAAAIRAARQKILVRSGAIWETLRTAKTIFYAKTGVITQGKISVADVAPFGGWQGADVLRVAVAMEPDETTPIANALRCTPTAKRFLPLTVTDLERTPGLGIRAVIDGTLFLLGSRRWLQMHNVPLQTGVAEAIIETERLGKTPLLLGGQGGVVGVIALSDAPRPDFADMANALPPQGVTQQTVLSGDSSRVAMAAAKVVGLENAEGDLSIEERMAWLQKAHSDDGPVLAMSEGREDAAFVLAANAGIALYDAAQPDALRFADVALPNDALHLLPALREQARQMHTVLLRALALAAGGKILLLALAAGLLLPLWSIIPADTALAGIVYFALLNAFASRQPADAAQSAPTGAKVTKDAFEYPAPETLEENEPLLELVFIHDPTVDRDPRNGKKYPEWAVFTVPFYGEPLRFGRRPDEFAPGILIDDEGVSRRHGEFRLEGNRPVVVDLASSNGIQRMERAAMVPIPPNHPVRIKFGDTLAIGCNTRIEVRPPHSRESSSAKERHSNV